jgi:hypothetical protein
MVVKECIMGRIGRYYYPDLPMNEAYKITKLIYEFPGHSMSVKMMAEKLRISARGGWTGMIIASLKNYGLTEGRGTLRTTSLAEKLVNPKNSQESVEAKKEAFNKIDLWTKIRKDYGEKALSSDFWAYLAEKLPVDRIMAQSKSEKIAKLYTESAAFCFPPPSSILIGEEGRGSENTMVEKNPQIETSPKVPSGVVTYGSSEDYGIWVKKDMVSIEFAESQIEAIKAWLKHEKAKLEPEQAS